MEERINRKELIAFIESALREDIGSGDVSTMVTIDDGMEGEAILWAKSAGIIAGVELAKMIFSHYNPALCIDIKKKDGTSIAQGDQIFFVKGKLGDIFTVERVVLNCMQRMSGIATTTYQLSQKISHTQAKILDTRKTTPNCRLIEKWAVKIGGGVNHRFGLYDEILVKDNHIDACGGIENSLRKIEKYHREQPNIPIIIECRNTHEWEYILHHAAYVKRILLDNMSLQELSHAVSIINKRIPIEASGNINEDNIVNYAEAGVDFISMGMLTHSVKALDMSLKWRDG